MMGLNPNVSLARAGAVAQYVSGIVIFCGGQSHQNPAHKDCLYYSPLGDAWHQFTTMKKNHNEASVANAGNRTYVIGGVGERSVEYVDMKNFNLLESEELQAFIPKSRQKVAVSSDKRQQQLPNWQLGPALPDVRARACAAASDAKKIYLVGKSIPQIC